MREMDFNHGNRQQNIDDTWTIGQRDPASGRMVLSERQTLPTAQAFIREFFGHEEGRTIQCYAGQLYEWRKNRYTIIDAAIVRNMLQEWLHNALRCIRDRQTGELSLAPFNSNPRTVRDALVSVCDFSAISSEKSPSFWIDGPARMTDEQAADFAELERPDPRNLLCFPHGTLDLENQTIIAPTPRLFNINAIDFDFDPHAPTPRRWMQFLAELWPNDPQSPALLQEWMGYCLVADTSQQKMLLMVGPKRSGKGTIGRVMARLVGAANVVGPTISGLGGAFGLQPLIGKSLAIVSDARFVGENIAAVVERLLCISGEDTLTIDRKYLGSATMKLPTRFVFLTNEIPRFHDVSGALAERFLILRTTRSFAGVEDTHLDEHLTRDLPGILVWAIEGLHRLRQRGHFVQPQDGANVAEEMQELASPVLAFVRHCCEVGDGHRTWVDEMYAAWKRWCESEGRSVVGSRQWFGRDLIAAVPGVSVRRNNEHGRFYDGIALKIQYTL
jgi:P4 family phage/plasmid primase-like protien